MQAPLTLFVHFWPSLPSISPHPYLLSTPQMLMFSVEASLTLDPFLFSIHPSTAGNLELSSYPTCWKWSSLCLHPFSANPYFSSVVFLRMDWGSFTQPLVYIENLEIIVDSSLALALLESIIMKFCYFCVPRIAEAQAFLSSFSALGQDQIFSC